MFIVKHALIFLTIHLFTSTRAQVVQDDWVSPSLPNYHTTLKVGEDFRIAWTKNLWGWFEQYAPSASVDNVTLWFTPSTDIDFQHLVATDVNVRTTTFLTWTVEIPKKQLDSRPSWTFQFVAGGRAASKISGDQVSSPPVVVENADTSNSETAASTTTSATLSAATPSAATPSAATPSAAPGASPSATPTASGLSTGTKVGIAVGIVAGVALLAALAWFFLGRKKRQRSDVQGIPPTTQGSVYPASQKTSYFSDNQSTLGSQSNRATQSQYGELENNQLAQPVAEMDGGNRWQGPGR